jgi:hypothetical protein
VAPLSRLVVPALALVASIGAAPAPRGEYEVKAAFLYNFAKFVRWPEETSRSPHFVIAVLGRDPFGPVLDRTFAGRTVLDRPVEVRRVASAAEAAGAHLVYVAESEQDRLPAIVQALGASPVLTVGEGPRFVEGGGMIAFRLRDEAIRFDVNLVPAERAHLKLSAQLVRLAQRVITSGGG